MKKDSQAKLGRTKCDFCHNPSKLAVGQFVVCEAHSYRASIDSGVKEAHDASDTPLKAASIALSSEHQD